jgi:hypothetical protein
MGYYTQFDLTADVDEDKLKIILQDLQNTSEEAELAFDEYEREAKWYEWCAEMKEFSSKYPDVLFTLTGIGEEPLDIWKCYFKNGKFQHENAEINFAEFDPDKLLTGEEAFFKSNPF